MPLLDVVVPQMGEGLQEVVIIGFHKKPGDKVKRDEILYSMETDKAVMEIESPYEGVVTEWLASEGAVLPIGAPIARIESNSAVGPASVTPVAGNSGSVPTAAQHTGVRQPSLTVVIPPRTRALCKQLGISEEEMLAIPAVSGKLMPADVEAYAGSKKSQPSPELVPPAAISSDAPPATNDAYEDHPLSQHQRVFASRIRRSSSLVIPVTMTRPIVWDPIAECTRRNREQDFTFRPTEFQTFAWCVAQASRKHPRLRSTLLGDEAYREYRNLNLGVAVGLKSGDLASAVVRSADTFKYPDFVRELQSSIALARQGKDQADAATQLHLTYMGQFGITEGTPLLVAPAIAILFVGAGYPREGKTYVNMCLTIDHRLINGVEGAQFLNTISEFIGTLDELY